MRKIFATIMAVAAMACAHLGASAQSAMLIEKNDGSVVSIKLDDIKEVTFGDAAIESKGIKAIDLGLPSGTLWADCNIGATAPEQNGWYVAWGELAPHAEGVAYTEDDYSDYFFDQMPADISGSEYDVCRAELGEGWQLPSNDQFIELISRSTLTVETINGVVGVRITGPNGNHIFVPMSGRIMNDVAPVEIGQNYFGWSGDRFAMTPEGAYCMWVGLNPEDPSQIAAAPRELEEGGANFVACQRCFGLTVRAVYVE